MGILKVFMNDNFFYGVVEDRDDPLMIGRLRVRMFAIHSPLKVAAETEGAPTENLLWCQVIQPITSAAISGVGSSPTGVVEGTHVVGFFRDNMCQDGVILGTIGGYPIKECNPQEGFNDPNGQYPRYINAPDTNILARGGVTPKLELGVTDEVEEPVTVENQDLNTDEAPNADKTPAEDMKPSPPPASFGIREMVRYDEGIRVNVYWDTEGYPTIGIGHLILFEKTKNTSKIYAELSKHVGRKVTNGRITEEECNMLFEQDLAKVQRDIARNAKVGPVYATLDASRKMAIENMTFQMGIGGVADFTRALAYMLAEEWKSAYNEMLDSLWAKQTPERANRVAKVILNGNLSSYGVRSSQKANQDKNLLFEEPKSPYAAKYPYNNVYESECGHIIEIDNTPGAERLHTRHTTGTFEEIHPDGTRVTKIVGVDYLITHSNRNVHIKGNANVVIDGDATVVIAGNSDTTIEGNVTQLIRGNVTEQIDGNVTQTVNGNTEQLIKGNVTETVEGTVTQTIDGDVTQTLNANCTGKVVGDYSLTVDGNYSLNVKGTKVDTVDGDWTRKAANINDTASGKFVMDGGGATITSAGAMVIDGTTVSIC